MDPEEEMRNTKRQHEYYNMLGNVADSEYGIPRWCPCGGRMIEEVCVKEEHDTHPGKRFFTCINYEADGFHYRQSWVAGVQEEIERLRKRVEKAEQVMNLVPNLNKQIDTVQAEVKSLSLAVDSLTAELYSLTEQLNELNAVMNAELDVN
ncbi:hypothetical protein Bca4012_067366 [Brassica carinata]